MTFPPLAHVRQSIPQPRVDDVPGTIRRLIRGSRLRERVKPGGTIAVGIGSRGVHAIDLVARTIVDTLREMGYKPFIVAAMGSHGGATAEGQRELLAGYGVTAEAMGVPVKTDMDTVVLGTNPVGLPIYFDKNAYQADGIVLANRVKPHTDFHATHESGVLKMLVIGLGKREGPARFTSWAFAACEKSCRPWGGSSSRTRPSRSGWPSSKTPTMCRPKSWPSSPRRSLTSSRSCSNEPAA